MFAIQNKELFSLLLKLISLYEESHNFHQIEKMSGNNKCSNPFPKSLRTCRSLKNSAKVGLFLFLLVFESVYF